MIASRPRPTESRPMPRPRPRPRTTFKAKAKTQDLDSKAKAKAQGLESQGQDQGLTSLPRSRAPFPKDYPNRAILVIFTTIFNDTKTTRKLCYRKDDRAMRSIYGYHKYHENCRDSLNTPTATYPKNFLWAFVPMVPAERALVSSYKPSIYILSALVCPKF